MIEAQLFLPFTESRRFEIPWARYSWAGGSVIVGAHSVDESWPWFKPWHPWNR